MSTKILFPFLLAEGFKTDRAQLEFVGLAPGIIIIIIIFFIFCFRKLTFLAKEKTFLKPNKVVGITVLLIIISESCCH